VVAHEGGIDPATAGALVQLAERVRRLRDRGLVEVPSTRLLVATARLIAGGIAPEQAARAGLMEPLTDDPDLLAAIGDLIAATV
jgi:nitric oxide reductase NorQ protein